MRLGRAGVLSQWLGACTTDLERTQAHFPAATSGSYNFLSLELQRDPTPLASMGTWIYMHMHAYTILKIIKIFKVGLGGWLGR